jgi:hypothetical protein
LWGLNRYRIFIRGLLGFGITPEQIKIMLKDNPARLMYLDESPTSERTPHVGGYGDTIRR